MSAWEGVRDYFRHRIWGNNPTCQRKWFMQWCRSYGVTETRGDEYRCILERAGYLSKPSLGRYQVVKPIPKDLGYREARREAYGDKHQASEATS